jgi:hypothetical protein
MLFNLFFLIFLCSNLPLEGSAPPLANSLKNPSSLNTSNQKEELLRYVRSFWNVNDHNGNEAYNLWKMLTKDVEISDWKVNSKNPQILTIVLTRPLTGVVRFRGYKGEMEIKKSFQVQFAEEGDKRIIAFLDNNAVQASYNIILPNIHLSRFEFANSSQTKNDQKKVKVTGRILAFEKMKILSSSEFYKTINDIAWTH